MSDSNFPEESSYGPIDGDSLKANALESLRNLDAIYSESNLGMYSATNLMIDLYTIKKALESSNLAEEFKVTNLRLNLSFLRENILPLLNLDSFTVEGNEYTIVGLIDELFKLTKNH